MTSPGRNDTTRRSDRCLACNYVHRVKASGTFGKHHIWLGHEYLGVCPGTDCRPEATSSKQFLDLVREKRRGTS